VRHQRQRTGLFGDLVHQQVYQARFDDQCRQPGGLLDRGPQVGLGHARQQVQAAFGRAGESGMSRDVGEPVGSERQDEWRHGLVRGQSGQERVALSGVLA
jgi:hypothetical protein